MGMPITIEIVGADTNIRNTVEKAFDYFNYVDRKFSTYKDDSEIMRINRGEVLLENASTDMKTIFNLAQITKTETAGYFDMINRDHKYDPSGIVKGWAIYNASKILYDSGYRNYYVEAGGDIQLGGFNEKNTKWNIGIKNPLKQDEVVKVVYLSNEGIASSGTYIRGQHIYNPHNLNEVFDDIVSITVIGPNVYEADRFATAAFAMGRSGITFIEGLNIPGKTRAFEGYMIDSHGIATMTSAFDRFTIL